MNLRHHGDSDTAPGLIDLAVNVRSPAPAWLLHALTHDPARWAIYPDPRDAMAALANRHGVPPHYVIPAKAGISQPQENQRRPGEQARAATMVVDYRAEAIRSRRPAS